MNAHPVTRLPTLTCSCRWRGGSCRLARPHMPHRSRFRVRAEPMAFKRRTLGCRYQRQVGQNDLTSVRHQPRSSYGALRGEVPLKGLAEDNAAAPAQGKAFPLIESVSKSQKNRPRLNPDKLSGVGQRSFTKAIEIIGRDDRIRTYDPHTPSVMRYQAALRPDRRITGLVAPIWGVLCKSKWGKPVMRCALHCPMITAPTWNLWCISYMGANDNRGRR
jgi:hypothetical protein